MSMAKYEVIVSVPYMWEKGRTKSHVQDPVDMEKLTRWFEREPVFCNIVDERLIAVFLKDNSAQNLLLQQNGSCF